MVDERERLRTTFDEAADLYQDARPDYPKALLDRLMQGTGVGPGAQVLEVGAGPGKATVPLLRRGLRVTAVEPGPALAAHARVNTAGHPAQVVQVRFEDWHGPWGVFDLVVSATAWHWVDPERRYQLAEAALRPGGHLAFWSASHVFPPDGDPFFGAIQEVYEAIGEADPPGPARLAPGELSEQTEEIAASGLFDVVAVEHFDWTVDYDAESYIRLLRTFSEHIAASTQSRERLFSEIRHRLAQRPDARLRRGWGAVLHIARRRDAVPQVDEARDVVSRS